MAIPLIIGAGSGLVSAALFAPAATGSALTGMLLYLAPLPLCLAGLGWGWAATIVAGLAATLLVGLTLGATAGAVFALTAGAPFALLCYLALLSRPLATPDGQQLSALEWYPPGHIVGWAAVIAGVLVGLVMLLLGYDAESYREPIRAALEGSRFNEVEGIVLDEATVDQLSAMLARALPAAFAIFWLAIALFNLWLGGLIIDASGRALRPWPRFDTLDIPSMFILIFAGALAASFLPGLPGLMATALAGALLVAYLLQGLAVIHVYTRGFPLRSALLATLYLAIILLGWIAVALAILGLAEPILGLRERAAQRHQSGNSDND